MVSLKKSEKISVLRGGISEEKEISILTANQVYKNLQKKYDTTLIDVDNDCNKLIADLIKYKGDILWDEEKPDGTPRKILNCEKLKQLGWKSSTSLEDGIIKTFESFAKEYIF